MKLDEDVKVSVPVVATDSLPESVLSVREGEMFRSQLILVSRVAAIAIPSGLRVFPPQR